MSDGTKIEWAANGDGTPGASWNPIRAKNRATGKVGWFCIHESEGCRFCYAERLNVERFGNGVEYKAQNEADVEIFLDEKTLTQPLRWRKPRTIFVCSMTDLFGTFVTQEMLDKIFAIAAMCPKHTFIVLTKRGHRAKSYLSGAIVERLRLPLAGRWPLPNVWLGVSAEDQKTANARIPDLLATPAALRFVSLEPLLGPIDLTGLIGGAPVSLVNALKGTAQPQGHPEIATRTAKLDWAIVGGESGPEARPMHPDWARDLRDQCAAAGVPFFFKQWGEWRETDGPKTTVENRDMAARSQWLTRDGKLHNDGERAFSIYHDYVVARLGKARAGRTLDGALHDARPSLVHQGVLT